MHGRGGTGKVLRYDGTGYAPSFVGMADLRSSTTGTNALGASCTAAQTLTWNSGTDSMQCQNISIAAGTQLSGTLPIANGGTGASSTSQNFVFAGPASGGAGAPSFRALTSADLPASASFWTAATGGINYAGGNVGIGTTAPSEILDIRKAGNTFVTATNTGASGAAGFMAGTNNGINSYNGFYSGGASSGARQKYIGNFAGTFAIGRTDDAWSANNHQLVILNNGNVGIATTNPEVALHVVGNTKFEDDMEISTADNGGLILFNREDATVTSGELMSTLQVSNNDSAVVNNFLTVKASQAHTGTAAGNTISFFTVPDNAVASQERLTILNSGNVGIGSTNPGYTLDVNGTIRATSFIGTMTGSSSSSSGAFTVNTDSDNAGADGGFNFQVNGANRFSINSSGRVGLGGSSPSTGASLTMAAIDGTNEGAQINWEAAGSYDVWVQDVYQNNMRFTTNTANTNYVAISNSGTGTAGLTVEGRVGIGLTSPNQQLEITESMRMPATTSTTTGIIFKGTDRFLHNAAYSTSHGQNTFLGVQSGNLSIGSSSSPFWGAFNTGVGYQALTNISTGSYNTAVGVGALKSQVNNGSSVAVGYEALAKATSGSNTAVGSSAGDEITTGMNNVIMGNSAASSLTTGIENTAIGGSSLGNTQTGLRNVAVGYRAFNGSTSTDVVSQSVAIGHGAGSAIRTSSDNIFIGYNAGSTTTTGGSNILIGSGVTAPAATTSNQLNIGNTIYGNTSTGNVGISTTTPTAKLEVNGQIRTVAYDAGTSVAINWNNGNNQYTAPAGNACAAFTLTNMLDGGTYTLAVQGVTSGTCTFTHAGLTFVYNPGNSAVTSDSVYTFLRMGTKVYVTWMSGFL